MKLSTFLVARAVNAAAVLLLVPLLTFFLLGIAPGDYLNELSSNPQISRETVAQLRLHFGLDVPFYTKYLHWIRSAAGGDLGYSFVYQQPIRELISQRVGNTVLLNAVALLAAWGLGMGLGIMGALGALGAMGTMTRAGAALDWLVDAGTTLLTSTPSVLLSLALLSFAVKVGLPVGGMTGLDYESLGPLARLGDLARHMLLPVVAVAAVWLPVVARHTRSALGETLQAPYITTARAKGLGRARILLQHAFRNALNPLTTLFGFSVSTLLSASLLVEVVMSWPGIGQLTFDAVLKRDIFLVVDLAALSALLLLAGNLIGDLLLFLSDPRVAEGAGAG